MAGLSRWQDGIGRKNGWTKQACIFFLCLFFPLLQPSGRGWVTPAAGFPAFSPSIGDGLIIGETDGEWEKRHARGARSGYLLFDKHEAIVCGRGNVDAWPFPAPAPGTASMP